METETCCNQEATNVAEVEENSRPVFKSVSRRWSFSPTYKRKMAREKDNSRIQRTSKSKEVELCVARFKYEWEAFTRGFIVEEDVDSLCEQMGCMNAESTSQERSRIERKKRLLNHLRDERERLEKKIQ